MEEVWDNMSPPPQLGPGAKPNAQTILMGNAPKLTELTDEQLKLTYACKCGVKHFLTPVKKL